MKKLFALLVLFSMTIGSAFAAEPPSCNDEAVKENVLNNRFNKPKDQALNSFLASLLITPDNQNIAAWKESWTATISNVRQERFDSENNARFCEAEINSAGGPDANMLAVYGSRLGLSFCLGSGISYKIEITEDTGGIYVTSFCRQ